MAEERVVRCAPDYTVTSDGLVVSHKSGDQKVLKPWLNNHGYEVVRLCVSGRRVRKMVHRIVAEAFLPAPHHGQEVRHLDGNCRNNSVSNLAWGTHTENMRDMVRHGHQGARMHPESILRGDRHPFRIHPELIARGEASGTAKIKESDVRAIRNLYDSGVRIAEIVRRLGINRATVKTVARRITWKHVA